MGPVLDEVERQPLTRSFARSQTHLPRLGTMVKAGIFFVAALYALGVCWPASAASSSSVSRIQTTHVTNGFYTASASFQTSAFSVSYTHLTLPTICSV